MTPFANESTKNAVQQSSTPTTNGVAGKHVAEAPNGKSAGSLDNKSSMDKKKFPGLTFRRFFTRAGVSPYDEVEWELRTAAITDAQGNTIFEQRTWRRPKTGP